MPDAPTDDEQLIAEVAALRERVRELEARDGPAPPKALQAERDRAQRYLDVAAVMLVGLDVEGRVTLANRRACEVLGRASEEIVGQSWVECFVPEDAREAIHATVTGIARGEVPYSEERLGPVLTASGDVRTIRWQNARTEDDQGRFIDSLSSGHDVTGELTASHALRQSEDTMAAILSAMPDLVLHQDADGRYLNCFKAPDVDTLLPVEEFLGKRMEEVLPEALTRPSRDMIDRVLRTGEAATSQYDLDMAEGVRSYDLRMAPVGEDEVVSVIRDVTEARRAVDRLEQSERRFRALFEESPLGLMIGDGDGVLLSTNRAMAALLGYPASELRGKSFADITLPEDIDETRAAIANLRTSATRAERLEKRYVRKDGDVVRAKVHVVALWDEEDGSERLFALVDDVTEQRQTASLLATRTRQQSALAQFSQEALGSRDVPALMQRACELLADTLDIEYAKVLELLPGAGGFLLKTGVGWQDGLVGKASISAGRDSQAGYTLLSGEPVVVPNLWEETRFCGPPLLFDHLVTSGMSVQIQGSDETDAPYGVLGAHTRRRRDFSPDDVNFLAGFATVIAATVVRSRHEQEIEDLNAQLEARVEARTGDLNQANERLQGELARRGITEEALRRTESERSQLTQRILTIQEDEHAHIARELHDRAGQGLSSVLVGLRLLSREAGSLEMSDRLEELRNQTSDTLDSIRNLAFEMRPTSLDHLGLAATLEQDVRTLATQLQIGVDFLAGPEEREPLRQDVEIAIYRAVHAALTNAAHHAEAAHVSITMQRQERRLSIIVEDDGKGFDVDAVSAGPVENRFGLLGMEERVRPFGGRVTFESSPGAGTTVFIELPMPAGAASDAS